MHKLLALDLDGTVLNSQHTISPALVDTIQRIAKTAHVVIVTGRHHVAAQPYYEQLGLETPIICCNGTYLYDYATDRVISENAISKAKAAEFIALSEQHQLKMVMYVRDAMLYSNQRPIAYMEALTQWSQTFPVGSQPNIRKIDNFNDELERTEYVWKFVVEGEVDTFSELDVIHKHFNGERSWIDRVDFAATGNSKGNALADYVKERGISLDECVAVGDNHNDISMLQRVGLGVAMQNADETVKASAKLVTEHSHDDEHGLSTLLQHLFL
jgi:Cof subfamily protein (haloacid dehalogenase superfamily)